MFAPYKGFPGSSPGRICLQCRKPQLDSWVRKTHWRRDMLLRGATPPLRSGTAAKRSYPTSEVRDSGQEELPQAQGKGKQPRGATPHPRSGGCVHAGGPRGATPHSRSGGAAMRKYSLSKVRSRRYALLEQL